MDAHQTTRRRAGLRLVFLAVFWIVWILGAEVALSQTSGSTIEVEPLRPLGMYVPGANGVQFDSKSSKFRFLYQGRAIATIDLLSTEIRKGVLEIEDAIHGGPAVQGAGLSYRLADGTIIGPSALGDRNPPGWPLMTWSIRGTTLVLEYSDRIDGVLTTRAYEVTGSGPGLVIEMMARSLKLDARGNYAGVWVPALELTPDSAKTLTIPYLQHVPIVVSESASRPGRVGYSVRYVDPSASSASRFEVGAPTLAGGAPITTVIEPLDDGTIPEPARDTLYWMADRVPWTLFPVYLRSPSPFLSELKSKACADTFTLFNFLANYFGDELGNADNPFDAGRVFLWGLRQFGVDDLTVLYQTGWREHLDPSLPRHCSDGPDSRVCYPSAREEDVAALREFVRDVTSTGSRLALGINLLHVAPSSPIVPWNALSLRSDGSPRIQVFESGQSYYLIRPDRQRDQIWRPGEPDPGTLWKLLYSYPDLNAAYCDAWGKHVPSLATTRQSDAPAARTLRSAIAETKRTMLFVRDKVGGPLFGEGVATRDVYDYSGYLDGYEREIYLDRDAPIIPDFEQLVVNRYAAHHGVGFLNRFYGNEPWRPIDVDHVDFHEVRAFTLAFGHVTQLFATGIVHDPVKTPLAWWTHRVVDEYYATRALQKLATGVVQLIRYRDSETDELLLLHRAVRRDLDFQRAQLALDFHNGLRLRINFSEQPWVVDTGTGWGPNEGTFTLPRFGYVAWRESSSDPSKEHLSFSALVEGHRVDYVRCPEYRMLNGHGQGVSVEGFSSIWLRVERDSMTLLGDPVSGVHRF
ncbi:MAG: hypothetical protein RL885_26000 [Planctomycetota bacterium]